jgi:hypothetical protein
LYVAGGVADVATSVINPLATAPVTGGCVMLTVMLAGAPVTVRVTGPAKFVFVTVAVIWVDPPCGTELLCGFTPTEIDGT